MCRPNPQHARDAVFDAFLTWLVDHPISVGEPIIDAVRAAADDWMERHSDQLVAAVRRVAERPPLVCLMHGTACADPNWGQAMNPTEGEDMIDPATAEWLRQKRAELDAKWSEIKAMYDEIIAKRPAPRDPGEILRMFAAELRRQSGPLASTAPSPSSQETTPWL